MLVNFRLSMLLATDRDFSLRFFSEGSGDRSGHLGETNTHRGRRTRLRSHSKASYAFSLSLWGLLWEGHFLLNHLFSNSLTGSGEVLQPRVAGPQNLIRRFDPIPVRSSMSH